MKKVLVKISGGDLEALSLFPFLEKVKDLYPESEINIITDSDVSDYFKLLPFKLNIFALEDNKKSFLGIHKFSKNLNEVFNIDVYFDLEKSVKSAFLGKTFSARDRVGWDMGKLKKVFFTHAYPLPSSVRYDEEKILLLEKYIGKSFDDFEVISSHAKRKLPEDFFRVLPHGPYLLFAPSGLDESFDQFEFWLKVIQSFKKEPKVIWIDPKKSNLHSDFVEKLKNEPLVQFANSQNIEEFSPIILNAKGFLTGEESLARLGTFFKKDTFLFVPSIKKASFWKYFVDRLSLFEVKEGKVSLGIFPDDEKFMQEDDSWIDSIHERLRL